ncbi:MAG: hypothetical protein M3N57_02520, partial [Actinomycetota bacterium]|nr:hypothetical protein [Actinomycetota bacterium]
APHRRTPPHWGRSRRRHRRWGRPPPGRAAMNGHGQQPGTVTSSGHGGEPQRSAEFGPAAQTPAGFGGGAQDPGWDILEDPAPAAPRRGRWLLVAATAPWAVVGLLLLRPSGPVASDLPPAPGESATQDPGTRLAEAPSNGREPVLAGEDVATTDPAAPATTEIVRFGPRVTPGPSEAAATAVLVARGWLGEVGPELPLPFDPAATTAYVEHLAVASVDLPSPDLAVVTVVGVLLDVADGEYTDARPVRVAVPVRLDATGARPAGEPWWLSPPELTADPPDWEPVDDEALLADAGAALVAAGYADVDVRSVERSDGWPLRVTAVAVAPSAAASREHRLWLREHLGELVVAGQLPTRRTPHAGASPEAPS